MSASSLRERLSSSRPLVLRGAAALLGTTALLGAGLAPAGAETIDDNGPSTSANDTRLPIVHTRHGSDRIKPNPFNPHPTCNAFDDYRTVIDEVHEDFKPLGRIDTANTTDKPLPLTQELSKTETFELQISGDIGGEFSGVKASIQPSVSYSLSWTAGQTVGPYDVPPGATGTATYGFRTVKFSGTQQRCLANGTWSDPWDLHGEAPVSNAVQVDIDRDAVDRLP